MNDKILKVYSYIRVSTELQVEGFSLDAQRNVIAEYCNRQDMAIVKEFCDAGISGASAEGRPAFKEMLDSVRKGTDDVKYVVVYKLSRFGRNTADTLAAVQEMQDYNVNLIAIEEKIDTSSAAGKLMCTMLASFAELDRSNIKEQSMQGRLQKARSGLWNGGVPPYGYTVEDNKLVVHEEEAVVVKTIFELYTTTNNGVHSITKYLNDNGYKKNLNKHRRLPLFTADAVRKILINPTYLGYMVYQRTKSVPVAGRRGKTHRVHNDAQNWVKATNSHPALVDAEVFAKAQQKIATYKERYCRPKEDKEHVNLLSGLLKCPVCGAPMYANSSQHKRKDGTYYPRRYFYRCLHKRGDAGHECSFNRQFSQEKLHSIVEHLIIKLVDMPEFAVMVQNRIGSKLDLSTAEAELKQAEANIRREQLRVTALENDIDLLDPLDDEYSSKRERLNERLNVLLKRVSVAELLKQEKQAMLKNIRNQVVTLDSIYNQLKNFRVIYAKLSDAEKSMLLHTMIKGVELNPDCTKDPATYISKIYFQFPIVKDADGTLRNWWENNVTVETVALLVKE